MKIVEYAQRRYTVLGQVGKPGTYTMPDRDCITLLEAIGNAGRLHAAWRTSATSASSV